MRWKPEYSAVPSARYDVSHVAEPSPSMSPVNFCCTVVEVSLHPPPISS
jgi:hypothetical protein